jgi:hypothetical protein
MLKTYPHIPLGGILTFALYGTPYTPWVNRFFPDTHGGYSSLLDSAVDYLCLYPQVEAVRPVRVVTHRHLSGGPSSFRSPYTHAGTARSSGTTFGSVWAKSRSPWSGLLPMWGRALPATRSRYWPGSLSSLGSPIYSSDHASRTRSSFDARSSRVLKSDRQRPSPASRVTFSGLQRLGSMILNALRRCCSASHSETYGSSSTSRVFWIIRPA